MELLSPMKAVADAISTESIMESNPFCGFFRGNRTLTSDSTTGSMSDQDSSLESPFGSCSSDISGLPLPQHEDKELWESLLDDIQSGEIADGDFDCIAEQQSWDQKMKLGSDGANMPWFMRRDEGAQGSQNNDILTDNWGLTNGLDFTLPNQQPELPSSAYPLNNSTSHGMANANLVSDLAFEDKVKMLVNRFMAEAIAQPSLGRALQPATAPSNSLNESFPQGMQMDSIPAPITGAGTADLPNTDTSTIGTDIFLQNNIGQTSTSDSVINGKIGSHITIEHDYAENNPASITTGGRNEIGGGIVLTEEEKKLLERESTTLPENIPLTKEEEKVLKKVRRKIKNKQSAMESRRRRKDYMYNLEQRVKHCTDENDELNKKVDKLNRENKTLLGELKVLKEYCKSITEATRINPRTCVAVILFSFALFVLPFSPLNYFGKSGDAPNDVAFRSRTLLSVPPGGDPNQHSGSSFPGLLGSELESQGLNKMPGAKKSEQTDHRFEYFVKANHNITLLVSNSTGAYDSAFR